MPKILITFGQNHRHVKGDIVFDKDCVAQFSVDSYMAGRTKAFKHFGSKWCVAYDPEQDFRGYTLNRFLEYFPRGIINADFLDQSKETLRDKIVTIMSGGGVATEEHTDALERADEIIDLIISRLDKWEIWNNPKPIPERNHDWDFKHENYDGADGGNGLAGSAASAIDAAMEILEIERNR